MEKILNNLYDFNANKEDLKVLSDFITEQLGYKEIKVVLPKTQDNDTKINKNKIELSNENCISVYQDEKDLAKYLIESIDLEISCKLDVVINEAIEYDEFLDYSIPLRKVQNYLLYIYVGTTRDDFKNIVCKDFLNYEFRIADTDTIMSDVVSSILEYDEPYHYMNDVLMYGCISGMVKELIYYTDTEAFFKKHTQEIFDLFNDFTNENGYSPIDFGERELDANNLAWFAYEEVINKLLYLLESNFEYNNI